MLTGTGTAGRWLGSGHGVRCYRRCDAKTVEVAFTTMARNEYVRTVERGSARLFMHARRLAARIFIVGSVGAGACGAFAAIAGAPTAGGAVSPMPTLVWSN